MTVRELNRDELIELKQAYMCDEYEKDNQEPSYGELAASTDIPDSEIFAYFEGVEFVPDDFWCNCRRRSA